MTTHLIRNSCQTNISLPSHTFVYVSTIQRMAMNLFDAEGWFTAASVNGLSKPTSTIFFAARKTAAS
jgi:hypothetical protein